MTVVGLNGASEWMLGASGRGGRGRAAMLVGPKDGKNGTSKDNRDALFVGYAGGLVVGVWIGNDDNRPLKGISGGGLPARVWRDFMTQALGQKSAPTRPERAVEPEGPVQQSGVPDIRYHPVGGRTTGNGNESLRERVVKDKGTTG